jgi:hypothetical protein
MPVIDCRQSRVSLAVRMWLRPVEDTRTPQNRDASRPAAHTLSTSTPASLLSLPSHLHILRHRPGSIMPSPPPSSRNRSRSRSPDRRQPSGSSSAASKPRAPPKQLDIYKRSAGGRSADPLDSMPPRGSTGSSYRRSAPTDEGDYRSRADRRAGREEGGGGRAGYSSGRDDDRRGGYSDDRRGGYGGDDRDRRGGDRYRDDDRRRGDDRDSRGGSGYGRPQDRDGPPPPSSSSSSSARPPVGLTSAPSSTTPSSAAAPPAAAPPPRAMGGTLIEIIANDRLGRKGPSRALHWVSTSALQVASH